MSRPKTMMLVVVLAVVFASSATALPVIRQSVVASGGTKATSASYALQGTVGQPVVGTSAGASVQLFHGYWFKAGLIGTGVTLPGAATFRLEQNYPNPFNPRTTISFAIPSEAHVALRVFDATGAQVMMVVDRAMPAGAHRVELDASALASGVYFYRLETLRFAQARKLVLLK